MELTNRLMRRAANKGEAQALLERARGAVEPREDLWEDEIPEDVFYSVTGVKASEAEHWQVDQVSTEWENSYYDAWIDIMSGAAALGVMGA